MGLELADALNVDKLLRLLAGRENVGHRLDLDGEAVAGGARIHVRLEVGKRELLRFVAKVERHAAEVVLELGPHADLQKLVLVQDALVRAHKAAQPLLRTGRRCRRSAARHTRSRRRCGRGGRRCLAANPKKVVHAASGRGHGLRTDGPAATALTVRRDGRAAARCLVGLVSEVLLFHLKLREDRRLALGEVGHGLEHRLDDVITRVHGKREVLDRALLNLRIRVARLVRVAEDLDNVGLELREEIDKLDVRREEHRARLHVDHAVVRVEHLKLRLGRRLGVVRDEVAKLAENVRAHAHHLLVGGGLLEGLKDDAAGVLLDVLAAVRDELDDAVPDFLADRVARERDELEDRVNVPRVVLGKALGENGNLQHHLFAELVVGLLEVAQQLLHNHARVLLVAHVVEEVKRAPANRNVLLLAQSGNDRRLVLLDGLVGKLDRRERRHGLECHVAQVRLLGRQELAEEVRALNEQVRLRLNVDDHLDGLKQHGVARVEVLHRVVLVVLVLRRLRGRLRHNLAEDVQQTPLRRLLHLGELESLEEAEELDLKPRRGHVVINVSVEVVLAVGDAVEARDGLCGASAVLIGVLLHEGEEERHDRLNDAEILVIEEVDDARRPFARGKHLGVLAEEAEECEGGLLLDKVLRVGRDEELLHLLRERLGHFFATNVGDAVEGEAHVALVAAHEVVLDRLNDEADELAVLVENDRHEEVAHHLLRVDVRRDETDGLHVAKVNVHAEEEHIEQLGDILLALSAAQLPHVLCVDT
eukprot:Opistho-1_new@74046